MSLTLSAFLILATAIIAFFAGILVGQHYAPCRYVRVEQRRDGRGRFVRE